MAIELLPLPLPASADASKLAEFGREVKGVNPAGINTEDFKEIEQALYKVCAQLLTVDSIELIARGSTALCYLEMHMYLLLSSMH